MIRRLLTPMVATWWLLAAGAAAEAPGPASAGASKASYDRYRVLTDRNMFVRNRGSAPRTYSAPGPRPAPPPPQERYVLTGIFGQEEVRVAFLEDSRTGETVRAIVGRDLGGGKVTAIHRTGIEYQRDGRTRRIAVGEDLAGVPVTRAAPVAPPPAPAAASAQAAPGGTPPPPGPGPALDGAGPAPPRPPAEPGPAPPEAARPPEAPGGLPGGAAEELLRRLRQRREQELRQ